MFTTHGHQIPGTVAEPRPAGMSVARCGGISLCTLCGVEAMETFKTPPVVDEPEVKICIRMQLITGVEPIGLSDRLKIIRNDQKLRDMVIKYLAEGIDD